MDTMFDIGDSVRAVALLRNDGTYPDPDIAVGQVLVEAGTEGRVVNIGLYLQEKVVYAVNFANGRLVGCLEHELAAEGAPSQQYLIETEEA
ncbi:MAG: nitrogen fixation protein NifZ [Actinomycetota bacterium]|nr:nitrogen fixation protein NifZ [Actinomycetota bacterium]